MEQSSFFNVLYHNALETKVDYIHRLKKNQMEHEWKFAWEYIQR